MAAPTAHEQYLIELINRGRLNPEAEADRYGINLNAGLAPGTISADAKQPLAPNQLLVDAARGHSQWMLATDIFSHSGAGGSSPGARMAAAGYSFNGSWAWGENIAWQGTTGTPNPTAYVEDQHEALFRSAGHRENTMNPVYREVGTGVVNGEFSGYNTVMTTENFAKSGSSLFITGVAYDDGDNNDFYGPGEGRGGIGVTATPSGGGNSATTTQPAGGYAIETGSGDHAVTFSGGGIPAAVTAHVSLTNQNVKLDLVDGDTVQSSADVTAGANLRNLVLLGIADLDATGNALDNSIIGNDGDNVITGAEGTDTLEGGIGNDRYVFGAGWGGDTVNDTRGGNTLAFDGINSSQLGSEQVGQDLVITRDGSGDSVTIGGYFDDTDNGADLGWTFVAADGAFDPTSLGPPPPVQDPPVQDPPAQDPPVQDPPPQDPPPQDPPPQDPPPQDPPSEDPVGNEPPPQDPPSDPTPPAPPPPDWVSYEDSPERVKVDLKSPSKNNWGAKGDPIEASVENVLGSAFNDLLKGDNGANILDGLDGNDRLIGRGGADELLGGDGDDFLNGGGGRDTLAGGAGDDTLKGGGGADLFIIDSDEGIDTITDFRATGSASKRDTLDLGDLLEGYSAANPIDDYLRFTNSGGNTQVQIDPSGSGSSFQTVAILSGVTGLEDEQNAIDTGLVVL